MPAALKVIDTQKRFDQMTPTELFNRGQRFAEWVAKKHYSRLLGMGISYIDFSELEQSALIGLLKASGGWDETKKWTPDKTKDFMTYAKRRINTQIWDDLRRERGKAFRGYIKFAPRTGKKKLRKISLDTLEDTSDNIPRVNPKTHMIGEGVIRSLVMTLPKRDREILYLLFWEGLSFTEIAKRLSVTDGAIHHRLKKIKQILKTRMAFNNLKLEMIV